MSGRDLEEEFSQISDFREAAFYGKFYMTKKIFPFDFYLASIAFILPHSCHYCIRFTIYYVESSCILLAGRGLSEMHNMKLYDSNSLGLLWSEI